MARRANTSSARLAHEPATYPRGWVVTDHYELPNGRMLEPGVEVAIRGERGGRFKFISHTRTTSAEWLTFVGGTPGVVTCRSFRPDRVTKVFATRTIRSGNQIRALRSIR